MPAMRGIVVPLPHMPGRVSTANVSASANVHYDAITVHCLSIVLRVALMKAETFGLFAGEAQAPLLDADLSIRQIEILNWPRKANPTATSPSSPA
jgi:hypothetical protein